MNEPVHRQETDKEETNLKDENEMLKEEIRRLKGLDVRDEKFLEENGQMCM